MTFNKIINIVLIISVVAIWSTLAYKFFDKTEEEVFADVQVNLPVSNPQTNFNTIREPIVVSNKNPFDKSQKEVRQAHKRTRISVQEKKIKNNISNSKPNIISYHGVLTDNRGNKVHILKINGQIKRFKLGQKVGDVKLLKLIENGVLIKDRNKQIEIFEID